MLVSCCGDGGGIGSSSSSNTNPRKWMQTQHWISNNFFAFKVWGALSHDKGFCEREREREREREST